MQIIVFCYLSIGLDSSSFLCVVFFFTIFKKGIFLLATFELQLAFFFSLILYFVMLFWCSNVKKRKSLWCHDVLTYFFLIKFKCFPHSKCLIFSIYILL
jgi:hypothetical protein